MKNRLLLIAIVLILIVGSVLTFAACGNDPDPYGDGKYIEKNDPTESDTPTLAYGLKADDTYEVLGIGTVTDTALVIPATYNGKAVTSIRAEAFADHAELTSVSIPEGVTTIGKGAFILCNGLTSVTLPDSLQTIQDEAFSFCKHLTSIVLPKNLASISEEAFLGCFSLAEVKNESSLTVTAGSRNNGYVACYAKAVYKDAYTSKLSTDKDGFVLYTDGNDVSLIGYTGTAKTVTIPTGVTEINGSAFHASDMTAVTIPTSVKKIGAAAFTGCNRLTSLTIPASVTEIEEDAFSGCYRLVEILNKSQLSLTAGSEKNGAVAYYAKAIYTADYTTKVSVENDYAIYTDGDNKILLGYFGTESELTLPNGITEINANAFRTEMKITKVTIPESVTKIGHSAFESCANLSSVNIPSGVTEIEHDTFNAALDLTSVTFSENSRLTTIGDSAFAACFLNARGSISIPASVTSIGSYAFYNCYELTAVNFTDDSRLTTIGDSAFYLCTSLHTLTIPAGVTSIGDPDDGIIYYSTGHGAPTVTEIYNRSSLNIVAGSTEYKGIAYFAKNVYTDPSDSKLTTDNNGYIVYKDGEDSLLIGYTGTATELSIPAGITAISARAFYQHDEITSVRIPNGVKAIEEAAFWGCAKLTSVTLPESITTIGDEAFIYCEALTSINIPNGITEVGERAFYYCPLLQTAEYGNAKYLGNAENPYLVLLTTKDESVTSCNIHADTKCIESKAFQYNDNLTTVTFDAGSKLTTIGAYTFDDCSALTSIELPDNITTIEEYAFGHCVSLRSITIPANVTSIEGDAFWGAKNLFEVYNFSALALEAGSEEHGHVAYYAKDVYTAAADSKYFTDANGFRFYPDGDDRILVGYTGNAKEITLPSGITEVSNAAFCGSSVRSVIIPEGVTSIGEYAFADCKELTTVSIPSTVKIIGYEAFYNCTKLASIVIPEGVTIIEGSAFYGCTDLTSVTLPSTLNLMGNHVFSNCESLTAITLPSSLSSIDHRCFYGCSSLATITIPASVTSISDDAFDNCYALTEVILEERTRGIGILPHAFDNTALRYNVYDNAYYLGNATNPYMVLVRAASADITTCAIHKDTKFINTEFAFQGVDLDSVTYPGTLEEWDALLDASNDYGIDIDIDFDSLSDRLSAAEGDEEDGGTTTQIFYGDQVFYGDQNGSHSITATTGTYTSTSEPISYEFEEAPLPPISDILDPGSLVIDDGYSATCDVTCKDGETTWEYYRSMFYDDASFNWDNSDFDARFIAAFHNDTYLILVYQL